MVMRGLETGEGFHVRARLVRADGEERLVETRADTEQVRLQGIIDSACRARWPDTGPAPMKIFLTYATISGIVRAGLLADLKIRWCKSSESSFGCASARRTFPRFLFQSFSQIPAAKAAWVT